MKSRTGAVLGTPLTALLAIGLIALSSPKAIPQASAQGQTRGLFLESRPKAAPPATKPGTTPASKTPASRPKPAKDAARLAFGYTLFLDGGDVQKRVSTERVFRSGERVRLVVETNRDAYLYVFHQEGGGPATLIFPDARVADGENRVLAHRPLDVPEGGWFAFDENPGQERLTLVVSEQPLANVPRGAELARRTPFKLSEDALAKLVRGAAAAVTDTAADDGAPRRPAEGTRGLTLTTADPVPSRVVMKKSAAPMPGGWVVSQIVLTHR